MKVNKAIIGFFFFAIIFQSVVSLGLLARFYELTALSGLNVFGLQNMVAEYPRYF
jgi:hypothetical protein